MNIVGARPVVIVVSLPSSGGQWLVDILDALGAETSHTHAEGAETVSKVMWAFEGRDVSILHLVRSAAHWQAALAVKHLGRPTRFGYFSLDEYRQGTARKQLEQIAASRLPFLSITYESLVLYQLRTMQEIANFIGLPRPTEIGANILAHDGNAERIKETT